MSSQASSIWSSVGLNQPTAIALAIVFGLLLFLGVLRLLFPSRGAIQTPRPPRECEICQYLFQKRVYRTTINGVDTWVCPKCYERVKAKMRRKAIDDLFDEDDN